MYCKKCGNKLVDGAKFCPKCGCQINASNDNNDRVVIGGIISSVPPVENDSKPVPEKKREEFATEVFLSVPDEEATQTADAEPVVEQVVIPPVTDQPQQNQQVNTKDNILKNVLNSVQGGGETFRHDDFASGFGIKAFILREKYRILLSNKGIRINNGKKSTGIAYEDIKKITIQGFISYIAIIIFIAALASFILLRDRVTFEIYDVAIYAAVAVLLWFLNYSRKIVFVKESGQKKAIYVYGNSYKGMLQDVNLKNPGIEIVNSPTSVEHFIGSIVPIATTVILIILVFFNLNPNIRKVKESNIPGYSVTYGDSFKNYFLNPKWSAYQSDDGFDFVEFSGDCTYEKKASTVKIRYEVNDNNEIIFRKMEISDQTKGDSEYNKLIDLICNKEDSNGKASSNAAATISTTQAVTTTKPISTTAATAATTTTAVNNGDYILPDSDKKYLTAADLSGLSQSQCKLARNEIYARYGRTFQDEELQAYFNSKKWYHAMVSAENFDDSVFNQYEVANRDLIIQYETDKGYR